MENRSNARISSSSSLSAPRSLFLHAPVRKSSSILFHPKTQMKKMRITPVVHVIRIHAIYEKSRAVLAGLGGLFAVQVVVMAICCGFYRCERNPYLASDAGKTHTPPPITAVPLLEGQGCIAGPKHNWVGIYWLAPTLLYTASVSLHSIPVSKHTSAMGWQK